MRLRYHVSRPTGFHRSRMDHTTVKLRTFKNDKLSKLFYGETIAGWVDLDTEQTGGDSLSFLPRNILGGLCSLKVLTLSESSVETYRMLAKICRLEKFLRNGFLGFGLLDASINPDNPTTAHKLRTGAAYYWDVKKNEFVVDGKKTGYPRKLNEVLCMSKYSKNDVVDISIQIDPRDRSIRYIVGDKVLPRMYPPTDISDYL